MNSALVERESTPAAEPAAPPARWSPRNFAIPVETARAAAIGAALPSLMRTQGNTLLFALGSDTPVTDATAIERARKQVTAEDAAIIRARVAQELNWQSLADAQQQAQQLGTEAKAAELWAEECAIRLKRLQTQPVPIKGAEYETAVQQADEARKAALKAREAAERASYQAPDIRRRLRTQLDSIAAEVAKERERHEQADLVRLQREIGELVATRLDALLALCNRRNRGHYLQGVIENIYQELTGTT